MRIQPCNMTPGRIPDLTFLARISFSVIPSEVEGSLSFDLCLSKDISERDACGNSRHCKEFQVWAPPNERFLDCVRNDGGLTRNGEHNARVSPVHANMPIAKYSTTLRKVPSTHDFKST